MLCVPILVLYCKMCFVFWICNGKYYAQNPNITEAQVIEAGKLVGAHNFIQQLPNGYHHNVMERGQNAFDWGSDN